MEREAAAAPSAVHVAGDGLAGSSGTSGATAPDAARPPPAISAIGMRERDQWLACMEQPMVEQGVADDLRQPLRQAFFHVADWMRNRAGKRRRLRSIVPAPPTRSG